MSALDAFTAPTREWFRAAFGVPTSAQEGAWRHIAKGNNALVVAPTGSGKTLSAFLWSIDRFFAEAAMNTAHPVAKPETDSAPGSGTRVLYISPLKALGVDVERNLRSPLVGIGHTARRLDVPSAEISVGVRTGDSTAKQRRDLVRTPPDVLITTPESLYLMLTSQARDTLASVDTVIIDEVHALAGSKRGAHLALSLERLDALIARSGSARAQRIGLSATVEPHQEVARFLGGAQPVEIIAPVSEKSWDITVCVPVPDLSAPTSSTENPEQVDREEPVEEDLSVIEKESAQPSIWPHIEHRMVDLIAAHHSTIAFVNSRRLAEKLTGRLNEIWDERQQTESGSETGPAEELARAHHGSVSKEQRAQIEEELKSGRLRCVVATSSLELGIDMGAVDLVIQVEAPPAVSAGLQRLGRSGHQVGETSTGWFFPKHRGDLLSTAVVAEQMLAGRIEALHIPKNPLDVLAQQTVAAVSLEALDVEDWFEQVRRSAPFSALPRSAYEAILDLLSGKYPSDRFADLRPRILWDRDAGTIEARPGAQRLAVTSGGTIPDRGLFGVYLVGAENSRTGGRRVGELDEEMVYESRIGDVFALGATSWRIEEITFDQVRVSPAFGQPAAMPFWRGESLGRPAELGRAIGEFTRTVLAAEEQSAQQRLQEAGLDTWASENLLRYLHQQNQALGAVPDDRTLVVERTRDELGDWRILLHSPFGLQVHAPWALAVGHRLQQRYGLDGAAFASDDGIVLRIPMMEEEPPGAELFRFEPDELEDLITAEVSASPLFAGRFREAAARALLLPRQSPGQRTPLWQQRQRASQLLEVAHQYPNFPMILEAMREVLQDVYDLPALNQITAQLDQRRIKIVEATTQTPSPFAQSLLFGYIAAYLYEADAPLAERRAAALSLDPALLNELLGRVELREFLDETVIAEAEAHAQRLSESRRLRGGVEGVADLLRLLGPLSAEELAARLQPAEGTEGPGLSDTAEVQAAHHWAEELVATRRVFRLRWQGQQCYAAAEDAARLRDGLGVALPPGIPHAFLEPVEEPMEDLLGRFARTHAPFTAAEAATALGLPPAVIHDVLHRLTARSQVVEGLFKPGSYGNQNEYVDAQMLRGIRSRSMAALRAAVQPAAPTAYAQLLTEWQQVDPASQTSGPEALAEALTQLAGYPAPASSWEAFILPARVADYSPSMLDELLVSGEFLALGRGALTGHDGWICFIPQQDAATLLPFEDQAPATGTKISTELSHTAERLLEILSRGGAWFPEALQQTLQESAPESSGTLPPEKLSTEKLTLENVQESLRDLFWAGQIVPDSFAAIRQMLAGGRTAHRRAAAPLRSARNRRRTALRQAVAQQRSASAPGAGGPTAGQSARWALAPRSSAEPTEAAHTRAEILLDRYPVVTRGSVVAEQTPGGFAGVYRVLAAAEESGQVRRGYFIEGLGAAQFTSSATIDRLREIAERQEDQAQLNRTDELSQQLSRSTPEPNRTLALAALDPANAYGAALDWPSLEVTGARPSRRAGALVIIDDGELLLFMERGGRSILIWTDDEQKQLRAAISLVQRLRAAKTPRIATERINGAPALEHPLAAALRQAGFHSSPSGLRFQP